MKRIAPLVLVLVVASLWAWTKRHHPPKMLPTRANCSLNGVHLRNSESEVTEAAGKPDQVTPLFSRQPSRQPSNSDEVWTWGHQLAPEMPTLTVEFHKGRVTQVTGTSLQVGSKTYWLDAGSPSTDSSWLGTPFGSAPLSLNGRSYDHTVWRFPDMSVDMLATGGKVNYVIIAEPP